MPSRLVPPCTSRFNPHAPPHWFVPGAMYMITAATLTKAHLWDTPTKRDGMLDMLLGLYQESGWRLLAWSVLANHYHVVATAPDDAADLSRLVRRLHARSARWLNRQDATPGRRVWYQYWDTCLTHETSTLARLNYVHQNPVKHGLVQDAREYRWCSMRWFCDVASDDDAQRILSTPYDRVHVVDDF